MTMIAGFWGLTLEAGKSYTQEVDSTFRISMAALGSKIPKNAERVSVIISYAGNDFTLCSLTPGKIEQQPIDITFLEGEEITFMTQGSAVTVDLTGNYIVEMNEDDLDDDEEDLMNDEEMMMMAGEGEQASDEEDDEEEGSEDWEDEEDAIDEKLMRALSKKMGIPISADGKITEVEEDDEEDMEEDMEEESEEEEEPVPEPKAAPVKAAATAAEEKKAKALAAAEEKKAKASAAAEEKKKQQQEKAKAAAAAKKEEQAKKVAAETKAKEAKKEDAKGIKELLNDKKAAEAKEVKKEDSKKKTLPSGLVIEDTKVGNGPRAKNGKKVSVRYIGRLTTGKVFDSNTKGAPFTFRLGGGEVIKGWDLGVQGMNVGGSRKLTIPANLAYGSRGAPPDIPKNATLEFEIKLLDIKG